MSSLEERISECDTHLGKFKNEKDLYQLNINELVSLYEFCQNEQSKMDKILQTDLYHLIGMGEMSAAQSVYFLKHLKKYLSYRPNLKVLITGLTWVNTLPKFNESASYKLNELGNITLTTNNLHYGDSKEYKNAVEKTSNKPFEIKGNTIIVSKKKFIEFFGLLHDFCSTIVETSLEENMKNGNEYLGIKWEGLGEDNSYKGSFLVNEVKNRFVNIAKA